MSLMLIFGMLSSEEPHVIESFDRIAHDKRSKIVSSEFTNTDQPIVQTQVQPRRKLKDKTKTDLLPPYAVILHNDDFNTFDFVIEVIIKVFHYSVEKAVALTLEAHQSGRSIVWSGSKEVAELKAEQIHSCGADPLARDRGAQPLQVSIEAQ